MKLIPDNAVESLGASLFVAKVYVLAGASLAWGRAFRHVSAELKPIFLMTYAAAALLLFIGGGIQFFSPQKYKAPLNLLVGFFALVMLSLLLPLL